MAIITKTVNTTTAKPSNLNQLIDVVQEDVSSSVSRKKYQVFVTGGIGPGITSSLYQTVFDQDFSLQTANPIMDMTIGLFWNEHFSSTSPVGSSGKSSTANIVSTAPGFSTSGDTGSKRLSFAKNAVMMREKVNNYRQMAAHLLGNADLCFSLANNTWPGATSTNDISSLSSTNSLSNGTGLGAIIHEALFINIKRLFARDGIRKETFAMRVHRSASLSGFDAQVRTNSDGIPKTKQRSFYYNGVLQSSVFEHKTTIRYAGAFPNVTGSNISYLSDEMKTGTFMPFLPDIIADIGAQQNLRVSKAGDVARILTANGQDPVGLLFYEAGVAVFDMRKLFWSDQHVYGRVDAMTATTMAAADYTQSSVSASFGTIPKGQTVIGCNATTSYNLGSGVENSSAKFIPDFLVSASIDNIVDHIAKVRFGSGSLTAMAFQNQTKIQSNIYFCRAEASEFNFSGNPTFTDSTGKINTLENIQVDSTETSFTFITGVGLMNDSGDLLAVAKLNRPIEKNDETELTLRIRLDF